MIISETDHLVITELKKEDAPFILALVNSPGWLQYIGDRNIHDIAAAENYISNGPMASYAAHGHGLHLVSLKETKVPIGICGLLKRDSLEYADIGFALLPAYTGKGYALEAGFASLLHGMQVLHMKKILAITLPSNQPSINLLNKLGLVFEKKIQLPHTAEELLLFSVENEQMKMKRPLHG